jgi:hypothetical protein
MTAIVSENFESYLAGILMVLTPDSILAVPNGGGFGKVIICSRVLGANTLMIPSEHPQNR